jgi:hypothetical protein
MNSTIQASRPFFHFLAGVLICLPGFTEGQAPSVAWSRVYFADSATGPDYLLRSFAESSGGFTIDGYNPDSALTGGGKRLRLFRSRFDKGGYLIDRKPWTHDAGSDPKIFPVGRDQFLFTSVESGLSPVRIIRMSLLDITGREIWNNTLEAQTPGPFTVRDHNGGLVISFDYTLVRLDGKGDTQWVRKDLGKFYGWAPIGVDRFALFSSNYLIDPYHLSILEPDGSISFHKPFWEMLGDSIPRNRNPWLLMPLEGGEFLSVGQSWFAKLDSAFRPKSVQPFYSAWQGNIFGSQTFLALDGPEERYLWSGEFDGTLKLGLIDSTGLTKGVYSTQIPYHDGHTQRTAQSLLALPTGGFLLVGSTAGSFRTPKGLQWGSDIWAAKVEITNQAVFNGGPFLDPQGCAEALRSAGIQQASRKRPAVLRAGLRLLGRSPMTGMALALDIPPGYPLGRISVTLNSLTGTQVLSREFQNSGPGLKVFTVDATKGGRILPGMYLCAIRGLGEPFTLKVLVP